MERVRISCVCGPKLKKSYEKAAKKAELTLSQYVAKVLQEHADMKDIKE
jgi:hypothetical protein